MATNVSGGVVANSTVHAATSSKKAATSSSASVPNALLLCKKKVAAPFAARSAALSVPRAGKRTRSALGGAESSIKAHSGAAKAEKSGSRTRLTQDQKIEILTLLTQGVTRDTIAYRFNCGTRTVPRIQENRQDLEEQAVSAAGRGDSKSTQGGGF